MAKRQSISERFWSKVDVRGPEECWNWKAGFLKDHRKGFRTYGMLWVKHINVQAHRVSWMLNRGPILNGLFVLHRCDNMACVNPNHLFLGTQMDNRQDCIAKGRDSRGERQGLSKLTEAQVRLIRLDKRIDGIIAKEYGVSRRTIGYVKTRKTWKHVV